MKKVLAIVLSLSMVLGSFGFAFAAEDTTSKKTTSTKSTNFSDVVGTDCEDAVKVLTDLGVVTGYDDGTYKPENIVTRAEMAVLVVNALGLQNYVTKGAKSTFTDMTDYGWAEGYIAYAQSLGVISGYGDGTFKPGKTVSYDEVATMLVAALGYTPDALQGTWPANYVTQAKAKGILDGITAGPNGANRGDVATMIYQTLDQAIGKVDKDGNWQQIGITFNPNGTVKESDTMLSRLGAKIYKESNMYGTDGDEFIVTKSIADNDTVINLYPYIGARIKAYMNSDKDIIAVKEVVSTFITGEYDGYDTITVGNVDYDVKVSNVKDETRFFSNVDELSAKTTGSALIVGKAKVDVEFDNNISDKSGDAKKLDYTGDTTYTFAVDLSGKTVKQIYSISYWNATEADYFSTSDAQDIKDDQSLFGIDFPTDDNGKIDTNGFDLVGVDSLDDIKTNNVVYVYKNDKDSEVARVAVGTETVSGKVSKVNSDGDEATIDGKVYKMAKNTYTGPNSIKAGDTMTLYLDAYGDIYDAKKGAGEPDKFAIVLEATNGSKGLNGDPAKIKLLLADGSAKTFELDKDIVDDSNSKDVIRVTTNDAVSITISAMTSGNNKRQITPGALIKYDTDKSGVIDTIELPSNEMVATADKSAVSAKGNYDGKKINKDAVVFTYDYDWDNYTAITSGSKDMTDEDNYSTATFDAILDSDDTSARYVLDDDGNIAAIILGDFNTSSDTYGVLTAWASSGDDDYDYTIDVLINGKLESKLAESDAKDAAVKVAGDKTNPANPEKAVYKLEFDGTGAVKNAYAVGGATTDAVTKNTTGKTKDTRYFITNTVGTTIERNNKSLTVSNSAISGGNVLLTLDDAVTVYKWNADAKNGAKYEKKGLNDIPSLLSGAAIELYDVEDNDGVFDIVLVH